MEKRRSWPVRMLVGAYNLLQGTRRVFFNLLFLVFLIFLFSSLFSDHGPKVENGSALLLAPHGIIVEEAKPQNPFAELAPGLNDSTPETELRDLLTAIKEAKTDSRIKLLVIDTSRLWGAGASKLAELATAIQDFKQSGKKVIARGDWMGQAQYYLAAQADEIYIDPMGAVEIDGYGSTRTYYKSALERFGVSVHVFRVGSFKSAVEPFTRDDMSAEARENTLQWMNVLWDRYKQDVATARKLNADAIQAYADDLPAKLREHKGDAAQLALKSGLVDGLKNRVEWYEFLKERVGENHRGDDIRGIDAESYAKLYQLPVMPGRDAVAIVVAQGEIVDGEAPVGVIGGDTLAKQIRKAREDDSVKALVLRVDSPGGSAFASEVIRRELGATRAAGKPVIVSMSSVAASGGYWIATDADAVIASPTTITGSIGIYGMVPTFDKLMNEYGLHRDGVGTTKLSGAYDFGRPLSPLVGDLVQQMLDKGYEDFLTRVGEARSKSRDEVHAMAQGQVWAGATALEKGLVDKLGTLDDAVKLAAEKGKLRGHYAVKYIERDKKPLEQFLDAMAGSAMVKAMLPTPSHVQLPAGVVAQAKLMARDIASLANLNDPNALYVHCFCDIR